MSTFALHAARVFDGRTMLDAATVTVKGATVIDVCAGIPDGVAVEDLGDVTLLPGLVDCHQHLCFDGNGTLEDQVAAATDDDLIERVHANARRALRAGITTIRDLGDRSYVTLRARDQPGLPTIVAAGPPITARGGHCWFLGGECDGDTLVSAVNERHRHGCDVVKIMVTGGALTPTYPPWASQFTANEVRTVVEAAHAVGLPVAAHCHGMEGTAAAVAAGVDTIEHCTFMSEAGSTTPDEPLMTAILAAGVTISATLGRHPSHRAPPIVERNLTAVLDALRDLRARGARVVVGTDAGIALGKPHDILPRAAEQLAHIGIEGMDLLATLTAAAADACGLGSHKGRVATSYDADLLAVTGNPATDPAALLDVAGVWHRGTRVR
jgi:imidazolonepropionase-like amidohydrolase